MNANSAAGDLESKLAGFVYTYLHAVTNDDSSKEQEALRWVCVGLEFLLGELLSASDEWNGWIDGIQPATDMVPDAIEVVSSVTLRIRGSALWARGRGSGPFWIEPFLGLVEISVTGDSIVNYDLKFGDAARGLATVPFDRHLRRPDWFCPAHWLFTFSSASR